MGDLKEAIEKAITTGAGDYCLNKGKKLQMKLEKDNDNVIVTDVECVDKDSD